MAERFLRSAQPKEPDRQSPKQNNRHATGPQRHVHHPDHKIKSNEHPQKMGNGHEAKDCRSDLQAKVFQEGLAPLAEVSHQDHWDKKVSTVLKRHDFHLKFLLTGFIH